MIEVKKTSQTLKDKQLGTQLIEDIPRYKQYQDASTLIFFIYDPDNLMSNPQGIIDDIETHIPQLRAEKKIVHLYYFFLRRFIIDFNNFIKNPV